MGHGHAADPCVSAPLVMSTLVLDRAGGHVPGHGSLAKNLDLYGALNVEHAIVDLEPAHFLLEVVPASEDLDDVTCGDGLAHLAPPVMRLRSREIALGLRSTCSSMVR